MNTDMPIWADRKFNLRKTCIMHIWGKIRYPHLSSTDGMNFTGVAWAPFGGLICLLPEGRIKHKSFPILVSGDVCRRYGLARNSEEEPFSGITITGDLEHIPNALFQGTFNHRTKCYLCRKRSGIVWRTDFCFGLSQPGLSHTGDWNFVLVKLRDET